MKYVDIEIDRVEETWNIPVIHNGKKFEITIHTVDGKVYGNCGNNFSTAYLTYFNVTPYYLRERHFNKLKQILEDYVANTRRRKGIYPRPATVNPNRIGKAKSTKKQSAA
jgi:hypothetical protein